MQQRSTIRIRGRSTAAARCRAISYLAIVVLICVGCGGPANEYDAVVSGTVTIEGNLAPGGTLTFNPVDKSGKVAIARIYPDGSFSVRTGQGDVREGDGGTVVAGEYVVTAMITGPTSGATMIEGGPPQAGPSLIHSRYSRVESSDLKRTIEPGENLLIFELEAAEPDDDENSDGDRASDPDSDAPAANEVGEETAAPGESQGATPDANVEGIGP